MCLICLVWFGLVWFSLAQRSNAYVASQGITNLTVTCFNTATPATTCPASFFSDSLHPTAVAHRLIALEAQNAVPVPGSLALLLVGLSGFLFSLRKKLV